MTYLKIILFLSTIIYIFSKSSSFQGTHIELKPVKEILKKLESKLIREGKASKKFIKNASEKKKILNRHIGDIEESVTSKYRNIHNLNRDMEVLHQIRKVFGSQHVGTSKLKLEEKEYYHNLKSEDIFSHSNILKTYGMRQKMIKLAGKGNVNWKLIYQGSRDGFSGKDFHDKCDGKAKTITIVKTRKNNIFGGYNDKKWNKKGGYVSSSKSFLFNFDKGWKFSVKLSKYSFYGKSNYGPTFGGGHDIYLCNNANVEPGSSLFPHSYNYPGKKYIGEYYGRQHFYAKEVEVFSIE